MGFPAGVQTVVLTGHVGKADGAAKRDVITFTPSPAEVVSATYNFILDDEPITVVPDRSTGLFSVRLLATDAATFTPSGWTYTVARGTRTPYSIALPAATPTADLADLTPVSANPGVYQQLIDPSTLGNSATRNVGATAGTVAAGDDPRIGRIAGIPITGTPAAGKVPTLTSPTAGTWQTPSGGGGTSIKSVADDRLDSEIVVLTNTASWAIVRTSTAVAIGKSIAAAAGDRIWVSPSMMYAGTQYYLDLAVMKGDGSGPSRYASSSGAGTTPGPEGYAPFYTQATSFPHISGIAQFVVDASEVDGGGLFTVNLAYVAPSLSGVDNKVYAGGGYLARWFMANLGPQPA